MSVEERACSRWRNALSGVSTPISLASSVSPSTPSHKGSWGNWLSGFLLLAWQEL